MKKVQRYIKCKKVFGTVIGLDLKSNYLVIAKSNIYTLYDKNIDINPNGKVLLYELPDGNLISKLTPNLEAAVLDDNNSILEYEAALEDTTSDKIEKESIDLAKYTSFLVGLIFIIILTNNIVSNGIRIQNIFSIFFLMLVMTCTIWLTTSFTYEYIMHFIYSHLDMQEYFKKTGEFKQEEIDEIYKNILQKHMTYRT